MAKEKNAFSEELSQLLTCAGLNKAEAARLLGVPRTTLSRWTLGDNAPTPFVQKVTLEALRQAIAEKEGA